MRKIIPIYFYYIFIVFGTYFGGSSFSLVFSFAPFGVYTFTYVRADFIKRLLLFTLTCELLLGLFWSFGMLSCFLPDYILLMERLFLSFFSLLDFLIAFLLSTLLPFLGSIDLWGDLLLDLLSLGSFLALSLGSFLALSLGSFLALRGFVGDFCILDFDPCVIFELPGLLDLLR